LLSLILIQDLEFGLLNLWAVYRFGWVASKNAFLDRLLEHAEQ
jgi:hypothetical protein